MRRSLLLFLSTLVSIALFPQAPLIQWERSCGGPNFERAECIIQTSDGGYIICGLSTGNGGDISGSKGGDDFWIEKLNPAGYVQWQKPFGGTGIDRAQSIIQTSDGGYIAVGHTASTNGDVTVSFGMGDAWVVKMDGNGNLQWQKSYGGSNQDWARCVIQTNDGGYLVLANTESNDGDVTGAKGLADNWLIKLNSSGTLQWQKTYGGTQSEFPTSVIQTNDGNYLMAGGSWSGNGDITNPKGNGDFWLVKVNTSGTILWQKNYGGTNTEVCWGLKQAPDKGFFLAGHSYSNDGDVGINKGIVDSWIIKTDSNGVLLWKNGVGGTDYEFHYAVDATSDGGCIVAGTASSANGDINDNHDTLTGTEDAHIVKYSSSGVIQWKKCFGGTATEYATSIVQTSDGGYIFAGSGQSSDGDISNSQGGLADAWVVKLRSLANSVVTHFDPSYEISVFPNPAHDKLSLKCTFPSEKFVTIQNAVGESVRQFSFNTENLNLDISEFANGIYFYSVTEAKMLIQTGKIAVE